MIKIPRLMYWTNPDNGVVAIYSVTANALTEAQAQEVIRRAESYKGLVLALENLINVHPGQLHVNKPTTLQEAERILGVKQ